MGRYSGKEEVVARQQPLNKKREKLQPRPKVEGKVGTLPIDDSAIPKGGKRIVEFNVVNGMATLKITVRNDDCIKPKRMIKPSADIEKGHWFLTKYVKDKVAQPRILTRTQKRRKQRMRSLQKMKQTLQMIHEAKNTNKEEISILVVADALNKAFRKPVEERESLMKEGLPFETQEVPDEQSDLMNTINLDDLKLEEGLSRQQQEKETGEGDLMEESLLDILFSE